MSVRISIIMPTYNRKELVTQSIASVINQSVSDWELIIIDNGSGDNTLEHLSEFSCDKRIRIVRINQNRGAIFAYALGYSLAAAPYVAFMTDDDIFYQDKLERQLKVLDNNHDIYASFTWADLIDEHGNIPENGYGYIVGGRPVFNVAIDGRYNLLRRFFLYGNFLCLPSAVLRRQCAYTVGSFNPMFKQLWDYDYWIRLCQKHEVSLLAEPTIKFRIHQNGSNESSQTAEVVNRLRWEMYHIIKGFQHLHPHDYNKCFHDSVSVYPINTPDDVALNLALFCINNKIHRRVGLDILLELSKRNSFLYEKIDINTIYGILGSHDVM